MANRKNIFLLKRSNVPNKVPSPVDLQLGELALNTADAILYTSGTTANQILPIGWDRLSILSGGTVNGNVISTGYFSGTTYYGDGSNLTGINDYYVTGGTYSSGTLTLNRQNGSVIITGFTTSALTATTLAVDYIDFNNALSPIPTNLEGRIFWDENNGSLTLGMHGSQVAQQIGLEQYYYIKNQSGATIENGRVVRAAGTLGASARILGEYMIADGSIPGKYTLGIATEDILNGDDGYVTEFGVVRGINTTGSLYGETWADGDVLYVSPTIPGGLTKVEPSTPDLKIEIALVLYAATNGSIFVRPTIYPSIRDLQDVKVSGVTNLDLIQYDSSLGYWVHTNTPTLVSVSANTFYGTTFSGGTFYGDGSNLTGISTQDYYVTGGTYSNGTLTLERNDNNSVVVTGFTTGIKSNTISGTSFAGNPRKYNVVFTNPYPNTNYSISITGGVNRSFTYESKTTTGFTINSNANTSFTPNVDWMTISYGEF